MAADRISSDTEHGRALRELAGKTTLSNAAVSGILMSAKKISSSTEKGAVLRSLAPKIKADEDTLKDLYMEVAGTISSSTEYRRAVEAIM